MTIPELMSSLGKLRSESDELYETYKIKKMEADSMRFQLLEALEATGLKSAKTDDFTASIVSKPNIIVTHEASVIDWLKHQPDIESDQYIGLKQSSFKPLAAQWFIKTGEKIPGVETQISETLAIRTNKKEK